MINENLSKDEVLCLYALEETSKNGLITKDYYFADYVEQGLCIIKDDEIWKVYTCERGNKFDIKPFDDCKKMCTYVIWLCSYTKEDVEPATGYFLSTLQNSSILSDEEINNFINKYEISIDTQNDSKKRIKKNQNQFIRRRRNEFR